ncbi:Serine phosphatase RsbU, regulator of sigma subunit [Quadrisphaera granulorum]|uniref:Serine phosphatase RsbU (Regulator of sigma subunit) n=1 Tax=Quadrisphaera granulorum TaxID=317664 RepID=A0A315ZV18_9ACTN|nr:SpoIIE family protein phosphatase [Quadrisphaera granulorum]PWJ49043.1 serine phosphatase RsbU (regulator of sigma subunit) [Quadrisphaera granulorum]SZE98253.1 Serine phosphatase RsbU, regulator of sigma subunit [Quadrisphaera granulorum]
MTAGFPAWFYRSVFYRSVHDDGAGAGSAGAAVPPGWWQRALASFPDPVAVLGPDWEVLWVSPMASTASGLDPATVLGRVLWDVVPGTATSEEPLRRAARTGTTTTWEARIGGPHWYELQAVPLDGLLLVVARSSDERRAAAAELAAMLERTRLVLEVSTQLGAARTLDEVAAAVVAVATEQLKADYGGLSVVDRTAGRVRTASRAQIDPEVEEVWADLPLEHEGPAPYVCRTGEELVFSSLEEIEARFPAVEQRIRRSGLRSGVVVPLVTEDTVVGALTVGFVAEGQATAGVLDVVRASAVAAGQAVRRALLLADRASAAEVLQRALLAPLPKGLDVEVAARYLPAGHRDHVGGDWHDAVPLDGDRLALVVGDVAGHDIEAAAVMGRASSSLRSFLLAVDGLPSRALTAIDDAFFRLDVPAPATVVAGVLTPPGAGGARSWRWANAGHPPPLLATAGGRARVLARRPELLIGIDPTTERTDHVVTVPSGSVLLLHSDGLVERRDRDLDDGTAELAALLGPLAAAYADRPLEAMLDALLAQALPVRPADDVVVLAVRTP